MTINLKLRGRLINWKFQQALQYIDNHVNNEEKELIEALAKMFGNIGWFSGDMANLLRTIVNILLRE